MAKKHASKEKDMEVDMSPMIDMVFLLLIFFVVTASQLQIKKDNRINVPLADSSFSQKDKAGRIVINILENGEFYDIDSTPLIDDSAISQYFEAQMQLPSIQRMYQENPASVKLHLRGDLKTLFKHTDKVMKLASAAGITDVAFATSGD